jgi:hypothetical protein
MKYIVVILFVIISFNSYSQKGNNKLIAEYEDTLKVIAHKIMNAESEEQRRLANNAFITNLNQALQYEKSFTFPFDSLVTISRIKSPDNIFRIFNWLLRKDNGTYEYYGIVHYHNKRRKRYDLIALTDNSANIRNPEHADLDAANWYGGLIYDIAYIKKTGVKYYTTLSYDLNDSYSRKKILDVMYFSGKNKIKFGLPIFKKSKTVSQKRVILEYDSKTSISVKYHKEKKQIIFDNLVPTRKDLEGLYEYYIPEGTFNAYNYKNGKWWLEEDVDIRNTQKIPKIKAPKRGLIGR